MYSTGHGEPVADAEPPDEDERDAYDLPRVWLSPRQQMAKVVVVCAVLCGLLILGHRYVPGSAGVGNIVDTIVPWGIAPAALLFVIAVLLRSPKALVATFATVLVWTVIYGPVLVSHGPVGAGDLRIVSENVSEKESDLSGEAGLAQSNNADVVVLESVLRGQLGTNPTAKLDTLYPGPDHRVLEYEFGIWSRYGISQATPIDLGIGVNTPGGIALRVVISTPKGSLAVYAVHLPQPNLDHDGYAKIRGEAVRGLVAALDKEKSAMVAVVGDLDIPPTDRLMHTLTSGTLGLHSAQKQAGQGFGFTWPAEFPFVRLDDVLVHGCTAVRSVVLPALVKGTAHKPISVDLRLSS